MILQRAETGSARTGGGIQHALSITYPEGLLLCRDSPLSLFLPGVRQVALGPFPVCVSLQTALQKKTKTHILLHVDSEHGCGFLRAELRLRASISGSAKPFSTPSGACPPQGFRLLPILADTRRRLSFSL